MLLIVRGRVPSQRIILLTPTLAPIHNQTPSPSRAPNPIILARTAGLVNSSILLQPLYLPRLTQILYRILLMGLGLMLLVLDLLRHHGIAILV